MILSRTGTLSYEACMRTEKYFLPVLSVTAVDFVSWEGRDVRPGFEGTK
jgi:hypothetical protein